MTKPEADRSASFLSLAAIQSRIQPGAPRFNSTGGDGTGPAGCVAWAAVPPVTGAGVGNGCTIVGPVGDAAGALVTVGVGDIAAGNGGGEPTFGNGCTAVGWIAGAGIGAIGAAMVGVGVGAGVGEGAACVGAGIGATG
jgi:hypothetical protein